MPASDSSQYLRDAARVIARAARDDVHLLDLRQQLGRARPEDSGSTRRFTTRPYERVGERARLLEDLLQHEMAVRALVRVVRQSTASRALAR